MISSGYDAMGYAMSKPYLRAELEADLRKLVTQSFVLSSAITDVFEFPHCDSEMPPFFSIT